jgi:hypothetical protein
MNNYKLSLYFLDIIIQLIRIQNDQLIKIISENENIDIDDIKHLIASPYEIKTLLNNLTDQ